MKPLPKVVDLASIISALESSPDHPTLVRLAQAAQRAQSCAADLSLAQTTLEAYAQVSLADALKVTPLHLVTVQHGLLASAVVLYARATSTHSDGGERGSVSISDRLAPDERHDHDLLVTVRNRVIAHVHADEEVGESVWHKERMILRESADGWLPGCVTRRVQIDEATIGRLRRMIPIASRLVRATFHKRMAKLAETINAKDHGPVVLDDHPFDAIGFFGSYERALEALSPGLGGTAHGLTH